MITALADAAKSASEILQNKAVSLIGAGTLVVLPEATKQSSNVFISLTEHGFLMLSYASWMQVIGCMWISTLLLEKIGIFSLIKWLWGRVRKNV